MMNIVACASDNYAMQCGVLFLSICANNKDETFHFFVLTDSMFRDVNKNRINDIIHQFGEGNLLDFIKVDDNMVKDLQDITNNFYPKQVLYRLFTANLLPRNIDKVLYLDCDIIVRHSLKELWSIDLSDCSVACVPDALSGLVGIFNRLQYPQKFGFFNSGVMLINMDYWRMNNVCDQFKQFVRNTNIKITLPDQDILNCVLHKSKKFIPLTYNLQSGFLYKREFMNFDYYGNKEELNIACTDPIILHLAGERPWYKGSQHPYKDEYYKYKAMTVWKDEPLRKRTYSFSDEIRKCFRELLSRFGFVRPIRDPYNRSYTLSNF